MVKMAERLTFGTAAVDWQQRINMERMRRERAEKARQTLRQHGVPTLLAARPENTRYLVGLKAADFLPQLWYVLFFAEHDPVIFQHAGWYQNYQKEVPWIEHWQLARDWVNGGCGPEAAAREAELFAEGIHRELSERGLAGEPVGVVGFDARAQQALAAKGIRTVDGWSLMLETTKTKTEDEINCLKMAYSITDAAWNTVWELLQPGVVDIHVSQQAMLAAQRAGAEEVTRGHVWSGPLTFERGTHHTGRIVNHGDLAYSAFCGLSYLGYRTCYYRTFSVGKEPDQQVKDWYRSLIERIDAVIDAIKPGATTADAASRFAPASKWGYKDEAEILTMEIGHGIGLHLYGYPVINRQWSLDYPQVFEEGMTIAIEGREGEPGRGGVRIEDAVVVTKDGAELIDHWPRTEILVAPRA